MAGGMRVWGWAGLRSQTPKDPSDPSPSTSRSAHCFTNQHAGGGRAGRRNSPLGLLPGASEQHKRNVVTQAGGVRGRGTGWGEGLGRGEESRSPW